MCVRVCLKYREREGEKERDGDTGTGGREIETKKKIPGGYKLI